VTAESSTPASARTPLLGRLGTRLLVAFVVVALSSVVVLVVAALVGTARGLAATETAQRSEAAALAADAAGAAYAAAGGWADADLAAVDAVAADAGARLVVRDADGSLVVGAGRGSGAGGGAGAGAGGGAGGSDAVTAPVVVDGGVVGSVRLGFGGSTASASQQVAWTQILLAALAALATAAVVAWFVARRLTRPLVSLAGVARSFAGGDRAARATPDDLEAPGEIGDLARAFDAAAEDVVLAETARRNAAADLAHELRTPLAALRAGLEELRDGLVEPDPARLAALHEQSLRLGRVVDDVAALAAAQSASLSLHRSETDLGALVREAVVVAQPAADVAGVQLHAEAAAVHVMADPDRMHQVVGNLLGNAVRYCRPGDSVTVTVRADGPDAVVEVADTGPGIAPDDLPHVFERLWRGRADTEGSGIGLAVVRELVAAHGGTVTAVSDGVRGTTMTVRLPVLPGTDAQSA
jgi:two-component system sensor histidine kinase BaeS